MKVDPFHDHHVVEDVQGYEQLRHLSDSNLGDLIDLLTVECLTAHLQRQTTLVHHLACELKVNVRNYWRPDVTWLSGFKKIQLAHVIVALMGPVHAPAPERKKSELVEVLAKLFTGAAQGRLEDKQIVDRTNCWLPPIFKR